MENTKKKEIERMRNIPNKKKTGKEKERKKKKQEQEKRH